MDRGDGVRHNEQLSPQLLQLLQLHRRRLMAWTDGILAELQGAFDAEADALRACLAPRPGAVDASLEEDRAALTQDLATLESWKSSRGPQAGPGITTDASSPSGEDR